jgi:hypothetical protein
MNENPIFDTSRREFLKRASALSLAAFGGISLQGDGFAMPRAARPIPSDGVARGVVFLDARGDGKAEGQRGLPGMLVSNGMDIARTDALGRYEVPVTDDTILYVIKPRNYMTATDDLNLPRFYYIHKPTGSPDDEFIYKGVAPTGPLPSSIDFPLYEKREPDEFEILLTADPQPYNLQHLQWYAQTTREFQGLNVAFGMALGDIVGDNLDLYQPYNEINALTRFPWYNVIGNHDLNFMAADDRHADETFKRVYGPTSYAFQYGRVHFLVMNNVFWEGFNGLRRDGWPHRGQYRGHLRPWQLQFIRNYLEHVPKEDRVAVCTHIPMMNRIDVHERHSTPEFTELLEILSGHPHTISFSGHTHINANHLAGEEHGYRPAGGGFHQHCNLTAPCGSWYRGPLDHTGVPFSPGRDGAPKGYAVVRFEGGAKYHIRFKAIGLDEGYQMSVTVPSLVKLSELPETKVEVNIFNATDKNAVRMRINSGKWIDLQQTEMHDPKYLKLRERSREHPEAGEGVLAGPVMSNHHWTASLPSDLSTGWHEIEVESLNLFGERWTALQTFTVSEDLNKLEKFNRGTRQPREA